MLILDANPRRTRRLKIARLAIIGAGLLNFFVFAAIAAYLGGDAVNGKIENGHYYLYGVRTEFGHKVYTEVTKRVFDYSRWHAYVMFSTWPLVMVAAFFERRARTRSNPD